LIVEIGSNQTAAIYNKTDAHGIRNVTFLLQAIHQPACAST